MNKYLSYNDRMRLERRRRAIESSMKGESPDMPRRYRAHLNHVPTDPDLLRRELRRIENTLQNGTPGDISKRERTRLEKQVQEDKVWLQKHMVPQRYMSNQTYMNQRGIVQKNSPEFKKALKENLKSRSPQFLQRAERYKQSMRALDPDNPEASNIENIRPEK